jgi:hypothetical protein
MRPRKKNVCCSRYIYAHSMRDAIKPKIIRNKKIWKQKFLIFWVFLKIDFWVTEKKLPPFFSKTAGPLRLKIFIWVVQPNWSVSFFLPDVVSKKIDSLYKILTSGKKGFRQWLQYFASPDVCRQHFSKKHTHPDWVLVTTKTISARYNDFVKYMSHRCSPSAKFDKKKSIGLKTKRQNWQCGLTNPFKEK